MYLKQARLYIKMPKKKSRKKKKVPFVSICTPTFNRRPFYELCLRCLENQTYPHDRLEWLVYDDGTDPVRDIVEEFSAKSKINVRYFRSETYVPLSEKRNFLNEKADGAFLCYWDDDDYYQPERIARSVKALQSHPECLIAAGSSMYCYFNDTKEIWKFGPYGPNHSTAAVLFFRKELLKQTQFHAQEFVAEERAFLKDYSFPAIQMPPADTIVVVAHSQNSFNKKTLISNGDTQFVKKTNMTLDQLISDNQTRHFIVNKLEPALVEYTDGDVRKKPDVLLAMLNILRDRHDKLKQEYSKVAQSHNALVYQLRAMQGNIVPGNPNGAPKIQTNSSPSPPPPPLTETLPASSANSEKKERPPMRGPRT